MPLPGREVSEGAQAGGSGRRTSRGTAVGTVRGWEEWVVEDTGHHTKDLDTTGF